jgi:porin
MFAVYSIKLNRIVDLSLATQTITKLIGIISLMLVYQISARAQDSLPVKELPTDSLMVGGHKSGYNEIHVIGGAKAVDANLVADDEYKQAWFDINLMNNIFNSYYRFKRKLKGNVKLAIGTDYIFLNQYASFSYSDQQATSGVFRIFGTWEVSGKSESTQGSIIFKVENRHNIGGELTPRNLGYEAGSALSTPSFKEMGWGITNLYWKQVYAQNKWGFVIGQMDPGDWVDLFPFISAWIYYLNEAYYVNPAMAYPNQGLGISVKAIVYKNIYVAGGLHDANGQPNNGFSYVFKSFFQTQEYHKWIEIGLIEKMSLRPGEGIHLTYWHQDARQEAATSASWGLSLTASTHFGGRYNPFIRAAFSRGNAALLSHLLMIGMCVNVYGHDYLGLGINWSGPSDRSQSNQYGIEIFYSIQLTQHFNLTPDIQWTFNPSFNPDKNSVGVYSVLRVRYAM